MHRPVTAVRPRSPGTGIADDPTASVRPGPRTGAAGTPLAVPPARIVDEAALPPWPSLLDDDDDDGDEPDWSALERSYERMLRLDREQRRR